MKITVRGSFLFINMQHCCLCFRLDRVAGEDTTIKGINIPKGMIVNTLIYLVHHDPEYWPEPERYDPERYIVDLPY